MSLEQHKRIIDGDITLVPYYPADDITLAWYQDLTLCKQVDNIDFVYTSERLKAMYKYLCENGECYYICFRSTLVGDITLLSSSEIAIVICREYQNRHIGRKCVREMLVLAREKGLQQVKANIYTFNAQSQAMFSSLGFRQVSEEQYVCDL